MSTGAPDLRRICADAARLGAGLDLDDCCYGEPHWEGEFVGPVSYYWFLAGLVQAVRAERIVELGTHYGGAIMAMSRGLEAGGRLERSRLVTVDVTRFNEEGFERFPHVRRVQGDCLDPAKSHEIARAIEPPVDLLFLDAVHRRDHSTACLETYGELLEPRHVVIDDIRLNPSMASFWSELRERFGENAYDCTEESRRGGRVGFGIVRWRDD